MNELKIEPNTNYYKNLNDKNKQLYLNLYLLYSNLLYKYLIPKLNLNTYEKMLKTARNHFESVKVEDMDFYQYLAHDYLKYFYIRNNLYIERLTKEELNFLNNKLLNNNIDLDNETINFISKTYSKVIAERLDLDNTKVSYGPDSYSFFQDSKALVIGFRFNEYYLEDNETEEEWDNKYDNREFELDNITFLLKKTLGNFEVKGVVVRYDDFSVQRLKNTRNGFPDAQFELKDIPDNEEEKEKYIQDLIVKRNAILKEMGYTINNKSKD